VPEPNPAQPNAVESAKANDEDLRFAFVHLASSHARTRLELRDFVDSGEWIVACTAPCDKRLRVEGTEARVSAQGMTTSNVFRIDPGRGRALVKVDGGSASAQTWGIRGLIIGIPVSMVGMGLFGYGTVSERDELKIPGAITLGVGAAVLLTSLPLLLIGSTDIRDGKGKQIAMDPSVVSF